jgi:RimJ/RimL family protein N-acetyltransferase
MQEAIAKIIKYGFNKMKLEIITAFTHAGNKKIIRHFTKK